MSVGRSHGDLNPRESFKVRFWGGVMLIGRRNKGKWDVRNSKVTLIH